MKITYQPASGLAVTVNAVFSDPYVLLPGAGAPEAGTEALTPTVFLRLADLPIDPEFDDPIIVAKGVSYRVTERRPAGLGAIVLALRKV